MSRIVCLLFLLCASLFGKIVEIGRFDEVKGHLEPDTLIILDIDNTLITPIQEVGTDQWFRHRRDWYGFQGFTVQEALELALAEWEAVQNITKVMSPEVMTPKLVRELQDRFTVMGLSTRGIGLANRTIFQLKEVGIDLSTDSLTQEEITLLDPQAILFRKGVLFTAGNHKGKSLLKLLERVNYLPRRIVYVNDKSTNLREVEVACEERHISFTGLRYGFLDDKVKSFRSDIARVQFENFRMILSDKEAQHLIER